MTYARAALAGLVLLAVASCTDGDPAGGGPTTPPATTPSPSPAPTPPTIPPEAQEHSAQGAAAFVEYWNANLNHSAAIGDAAVLDRLASPDCDACRNYASFIRNTTEAGGFSESPGYQTTVTASQLMQGQFVVTAEIGSDEFRFRRSPDSPVETVHAARYEYLYELVWTPSGWLVGRIAEQDVPG